MSNANPCCPKTRERHRLTASMIGAAALLVLIAYLLPGTLKHDRVAKRSMLLSSALSNLDQAYIILNKDMNVELWSAGAEHLFKVPEDQVLGKGIDWMIPPDLRSAHSRGAARWWMEPDTVARKVECTAMDRVGNPLHIVMRIRGCLCEDKIWRLVVQCEPQAIEASEIRLPPRTIGSAK